MERLEVLQQKLEQWCAASIRALAGEPTAHYRGHYLLLKEQPMLLCAPYLHLDLETHDAAKLRGVADAIALRLLHSDQQLHASLSPENPIQRLVFELLEQLRTESLAPDNMPGMRTNLQRRFLYWANKAGSSALVENSVGLLIFTVNLMCWSRLLKLAIPETIEDTIEATRWKLALSIGKPLRAMSRVTHSQQQFSEHALDIARIINTMIEDAAQASDQDDDVNKTVRILSNAKLLNLQWLDADGLSLEQRFAISSTEKITHAQSGYYYQVYNRAYDKEVKADKTIRIAQLKKMRIALDKHIRQQSVNSHRVARYLRQLIASPALAGWSFGEEEGHLDSARLARLVTSPNDRKLFRKLSHKPNSDCIVSIVIDNSGSMTHHNMAIAAMVDTLAKILELANIKSEVLGFTTVNWNGGKVAKEWIRAGKPANPGRLTSLCHTIYKSAETPWRRARQAIAGLLKSDNFREGVDGEALEWAVKRIESRPEERKIIVMISDGSPMDTATHAANDDRYLDQHLAQVAAIVEARPDINLCALGVGLDLSAYYRQSMSISVDNELLTKDFMAVADLIQRAH
jgi:cobaltochelatase CobT